MLSFHRDWPSFCEGQFRIDCKPVRDIGMRDATDRDIFEAAKADDIVLVTKDADFVALVQRFGPPPRIVWVTCGNTSNSELERVFATGWPLVAGMLSAGEPIVELN